jgi:hypothetical protein
VQPEILNIFLGELHIVYVDRAGRFSSCGECDMGRLCSVSLYYPFLDQFWIASRLVCSLCEAMAGSLPVSSTTVSLAKVAMVDSHEVGRSAVHRRYNNGPRTLPLGTPTLTVENFVYSVSAFTRKCLLCK